MQQTLQTFYQNLDQYYAAGDVDQMERFLLETEAQSNREKYMHLGMKFAGIRTLGACRKLYDLIKYPEK